MDSTLSCASLCATTDSVVITPPLGTSLAGYFTDRKAAGVLDDLYASVLVLQKGPDKMVWVACDLIGLPADFAFPIRKAIAGRLGMPVCAVVMSATHTHTGPVTEVPAVDPKYLPEGPLVDQKYMADTAARIIETAVSAAGRLQPAAMEYGAVSEPRFAFNRRYFMKDGSVMTNPGAQNLAVLGPAGEVDHTLHVIHVLDGGRNTLAVVVNCALHADTTDGNLISADWPGALRAKLHQSTGSKFPVLILNGAAGDVNHFDVMNHRAVQSVDEARRIGSGYAETVLKVLDQARPLDVKTIAAACTTVQVPYRTISAEELAAARQIVAELKDDPKARLEGHLESQDIARGNKAIRLMFAESIVSAAQKLQGKTLPVEIAAVRLGPLVIACIGGEVFSQIGLKIRRDSPFQPTLVAELANGSAGYLGTKQSYAQGGYETLLGERVCDNVEDYIFQSVSELMGKLKEKQPM